jgi:hypothetical protein
MGDGTTCKQLIYLVGVQVLGTTELGGLRFGIESRAARILEELPYLLGYLYDHLQEKIIFTLMMNKKFILVLI